MSNVNLERQSNMVNLDLNVQIFYDADQNSFPNGHKFNFNTILSNQTQTIDWSEICTVQIYVSSME